MATMIVVKLLSQIVTNEQYDNIFPAYYGKQIFINKKNLKIIICVLKYIKSLKKLPHDISIPVKQDDLLPIQVMDPCCS